MGSKQLMESPHAVVDHNRLYSNTCRRNRSIKPEFCRSLPKFGPIWPAETNANLADSASDLPDTHPTLADTTRNLANPSPSVDDPAPIWVDANSELLARKPILADPGLNAVNQKPNLVDPSRRLADQAPIWPFSPYMSNPNCLVEEPSRSGCQGIPT